MNQITTTSPLIVQSKGTIFEATEDCPQRQAAFFGELFRADDGTIHVVFQAGAVKHAADSKLVIFSSRDEGETWRERPHQLPATFRGVPVSQALGILARQSDGALLLFATLFDRTDPQRPIFHPETEALLPSFLVVASSPDEGESWSEWTELETPGYEGCSLTGPVLDWGDGSFALPFESWMADQPHRACLMEFDGKSLSPSEIRVLASDPTGRRCFWDQRLCRGAGEREVLGCFWTHDREAKRDLPVHFLRADLAGEIPAPLPTGIKGQIAAPVLLSDGRLLALVVERESKVGTIQLHESADGGKTWQPGPIVHEHSEAALLRTKGGEDIEFAAYWEDMGKWSFGHPALLDLGNGGILCTYYAGTPQRLGIHWEKFTI